MHYRHSPSLLLTLDTRHTYFAILKPLTHEKVENAKTLIPHVILTVRLCLQINF